MSDRQWLKGAIDVVKATIEGVSKNELQLFAPAIAYALVVSLAPLTVALNVFGGQLISADAFLPGSPLSEADVTAERIMGSGPGFLGPLASVIGIIVIAWGASALFRQLVVAIGRIWGGEPPPSGLRAFAHSNAKAFAMLGVAASALFVSAIAGNVLSTLAAQIERALAIADLPGGWVRLVLGSKVLLDFITATFLYSVAFVMIPSRRPRVKDVLPGALLTGAAYALGQAALGVYLDSSGRLTALGEFGAFLGFLVWAYYTGLIVLWGAQLTYEIARRRALHRGGVDAEVYA